MDSINLDRSFKPGDLVMHFKGKQYQILQFATHTETNECLVIYQALYGDYGIYARPLVFKTRVYKALLAYVP